MDIFARDHPQTAIYLRKRERVSQSEENTSMNSNKLFRETGKDPAQERSSVSVRNATSIHFFVSLSTYL
jgi:hypothetical protein